MSQDSLARVSYLSDELPFLHKVAAKAARQEVLPRACITSAARNIQHQKAGLQNMIMYHLKNICCSFCSVHCIFQLTESWNVNQLKKLALVLRKLLAADHAFFPPESFPISNYGSGQSQLYAWQR